MGVISDGSYGIAKDIVFSFPVTIKNKQWKIVSWKLSFLGKFLTAFVSQVQDLKLDDFARSKLDITTKELLEEKDEAMTVCNANWLSDSKLW